MSKKEYERKQREEQEAAAHVFQDFITTFQNTSTPPKKTFVKSGILYAEQTLAGVESGELYNPKPVIKQKNSSTIKNAIECARILKDNKIEKIKKQDKPKSNLELLKEELKMRHKERDERGKYKEEINQAINYFDGGDPNSTNLFVANLSSRITENDLMLLFGAFGPLASVKIMWPRGDDKSRNSNCGFVAFMSRKDAERALNNLKNREDMRVGWGKFVDVPQHPIFIPNSLLKLYLPPPLTGLPFNAQPIQKNYEQPNTEEELNELLYNSVVKVTIPFDKKVLVIVNRMVEFVVIEGPMFEAMIMNREIRNPDFSFLFDYQSPIHIYYRWKLYSILNGDSQKSWSMKPFRMFKDGPIWIPPLAPNYTEGMPDSLFRTDDSVDKTQMSTAQSNRLILILKNLTMSRSKILEGMVFCISHIDAINDSIDIIIDSLKGPSTSPVKKVSRMYLLSDIIRNCALKNTPLRILNENCQDLISVFEHFHATLSKLSSQSDIDNFKSRILKIINCWDTCKYFPFSVVKKMESAFTYSNLTLTPELEEDTSSTDEPLDGASLLKRSLKNKNDNCIIPAIIKKEDKPRNNNFSIESFVASKWNTIDPEEVQAQAMSTEKLYYLELEKNQADSEEFTAKTVESKAREVSVSSSKWDSEEERRSLRRSSKEERSRKSHSRSERRRKESRRYSRK